MRNDSGTTNQHLKQRVVGIMKRSLPPHTKISEEAKEAMVKCVRNFITTIYSQEQKNSVNVSLEGLLCAIEKMNLNKHVQNLVTFYRRFKGVPPQHHGSTSNVDAGASSCDNDNIGEFDPLSFLNLDQYPDD